MRIRSLLIAGLVVVSGLATATSPSTAASGQATGPAIAARVERAAHDGLLRDQQVAIFFTDLGLAIPARADATFTAPEHPECAAFRDALAFAGSRGVVTGARFSTASDDLLQTVYSFHRERDAETFESQVLDAGLAGCSRASAQTTNEESTVLDIDERSGRVLAAFSDSDTLFLATLAQLTPTPGTSEPPSTDFTTFWLRDGPLVTRLAVRYSGLDVYDPNAPDGLTEPATAPVLGLVDAAAADLAAADGLQLAFGVPASAVPWQSPATCDTRANGLLYGTLFDQRRSGGLSSTFVRDWSIADDGLSYSLTLRDGIEWSDGSPVTADDLVFALELYRGNPSSAAALGPVSSVTKVDDLTVEVTYSTPAAASGLWALSGTAGVIARPNAPLPASAGPFVYTSFIPAAEAIVGNWDDVKRLAAALTFHPVREDGGGLAQLRDLSADIATIAPSSVDDARADGFRVSVSPTGSGAAWYFNYRAHPIFGDVSVRQAFAHAIDRRALVDDVLGGYGRVTDVPVGPGWGFAPEVEYPYDPGLAAQLLEEAGWSFDDELGVLVFDGTAGADSGQIVERLQEDFTAVGLNADVRLVTGTELSRSLTDGSADVVVASVFQTPYGANTIGDAILPTSNVARAFGSDAAFADSEITRLIEEARGESDPEERLRIYQELQEVYLQELPYVWLYASDNAIGWNREFVRGRPRAPFDPCGAWNLEGVERR